MEVVNLTKRVSPAGEVILPLDIIDEVVDSVMKASLEDLNDRVMTKARREAQLTPARVDVMRKAIEECQSRELEDGQGVLPDIRQALTPLALISRKFHECALRRLYRVHTISVYPNTDLVGRLMDTGRGLSFVRRLTLVFPQEADNPPLSIYLLSVIFMSAPHLQFLTLEDCIFGDHSAFAVPGYRLISLTDLVVCRPSPRDCEYPSCVWSFLQLIASVDNLYIGQLRDYHSDDQLLAIPERLRTHLTQMTVKQLTLAPSRSVANVGDGWGPHLTAFPPSITMPTPGKVLILRVQGVSVEHWSSVHALCHAARDGLKELEVSLSAAPYDSPPFGYALRFPPGPFPELRTLSISLPEPGTIEYSPWYTLHYPEDSWQTVLVSLSKHLPPEMKTIRLKFSTSNLAEPDAMEAVNAVSWREWGKSLVQVAGLEGVLVYWSLPIGLDVAEAIQSIHRELTDGLEEVFSPVPSVQVKDIRTRKRHLRHRQR